MSILYKHGPFIGYNVVKEIIMLNILKCRRSIIALIGISVLTFLGYTKGIDVSMAISGIVLAVAGSNALEKRGINKD